MNETKPTPGPWVIVCRGSEGYCVMRSMRHITCRADMGFVADCTAKPFEESKANAEFIATAYEACRAINPENPLAVVEAIPELLSQVREIVDHATKYGAAPLSAEKMLDRARAAISKAEGE